MYNLVLKKGTITFVKIPKGQTVYLVGYIRYMRKKCCDQAIDKLCWIANVGCEKDFAIVEGLTMEGGRKDSLQLEGIIAQSVLCPSLHLSFHWQKSTKTIDFQVAAQ
jgi:hypothetical protein